MTEFVEQRPLGSQGLLVSPQGLGCMGMTGFYGDFDRLAQEELSLKTIERALELGINFFDTAWIYQSFGQGGGGNFTNEELLGKAIARFGREKFVIATKFGFLLTATGLVTSSSEETIRSQLADSLRRLGTDYIDLYYQHRPDPTIPIEDTMLILKSLVEAGTIKYVGLSECSPEELRRAHAVQPITAIQMEWSLQTRDVEVTMLAVARELGVGIVPYSPLGRGFLTAAFTNIDKLDAGDWRLKSQPRWSAENFEKNANQTAFFEIAKLKGCTPAQLALAWVSAQGRDVFPIPGTKSATRLEENVGALQVVLTAEEIQQIAESVPTPAGARYGVYKREEPKADEV